MRVKKGILLVLSMLLINSCAQIPKDIKIYKAAHEDAAIIREQEKEYISCVDPRFNDFYCVSKEDFQKLLMCPMSK